MSLPLPARLRSIGLALALSMPCLSAATAAELKLDIEVPRLQVAEYHRPYVAVWIEDGERTLVRHLSVWYELSNREGDSWLKDMRQWWRRGGRALQVPVDGVTGATRAPGTHRLAFDVRGALADLAPGDYRLLVEAAREVGGREVLELPFSWPPREATRAEARGERELGGIVLELRP